MIEALHYDKTDEELEYWILYCVMVAGKNANSTYKQLDRFLGILDPPYTHIHYLEYLPEKYADSPLDFIRHLITEGALWNRIRSFRLGQYNKLYNAFIYLAKNFSGAKLRTCTVEDLLEVPGIGHKTTRFFIMTTRRGVRHAALDTHILKYLRAQGIDAPLSTPVSSVKYAVLENKFLELADRSGMTPAEFDYQVWLSYRKE